MSTKALRELIKWAARGDSPHACEARAELEAIEKAARVVDKGRIYYGAPDAKDALELLESIAKDAK